MSAQWEGTLRLTMLGDWHVGTGAGRPGELDRLIARDSEGLPYVPAKTLTGMWRDGCERIACGLDRGATGAWTGWVNEIFGDEPNRRNPGLALAAPIEAGLSLRPARLSQTLRQGLCELQPYPAQSKEESKEAYEAAKKQWDDKRLRRERLRAGLTFPKPGVAIDAYTGRARDDFLRMEEMARRGMNLAAPFELRTASRSGVAWTDPQRATIEALLVAGASEIERLGGKRRRGTGRCRASVTGLAALNRTLLTRFDKNPAALPDNNEPAPTSAPAPPGGQGWRSLPIRLELLTPVVAADATVGNVVESLDYMPGSLLLPVVARALRAAGSDPAAEIAAGNLVVLPATVEIDGRRGLPVPFALHVPKRAEGLAHAHNRLIETEADEREEHGNQKERVENRQAKRTGYVVSVGAGELIPYKNVDRSVTTHSTIAEEEQRPTEAVGGVFSYQAIPAGTVLRSEIRLRGGLADRLQIGEVRLGRSKKDDYGHVRIVAYPWRDLSDAEADRFPRVSPTAAPGLEQVLHVWVLSDLLLRDEGLRPGVDHSVLQEALANALEVDQLHLRLGKQGAEGLLGADLRVRRYDSWQAQWGLPRPSLVGVQAGSCLRVVIDAGHAATPERLAEVEIAGLGERRAEGFGQVRFEDPLLTEPSHGRPDRQDPAAPKPALVDPIQRGASEYDVAAAIERAAWRKAIAEAATALALHKGRREAAFGFDGSRPGPSQLGGLRSHIAGLTKPEPDTGPMLAWLTRLKNVPKRREVWCGVLERIEALLTEPGEVWKHLNVAEMVEPLTADCRERLERQLWGKAVAAAIGAAIRAQIFASRRAAAMRTEEPGHA